MFFIKKSQALHTACTLVALGLLATACGTESKKKDRNPSIHVEFDGPIVVPTPAPNPVVGEPNIMPTPGPTPTPEVDTTSEGTDTSVVKPGIEVPVQRPLPAARELTAEEKLQYLTNDDSFIKLPRSGIGFRGTGFDVSEESYVGTCMEDDKNITIASLDRRPAQEYTILPLTSARQVKEALGYLGHPLYMSGQIDTSDSQKIVLIAIAKKIRAVESVDSMVLRPGAEDLSTKRFADRCGQLYKKGAVRGHVYYSLISFELDEKNSREAILSRLIDSKALGTFADQKTFTENLNALASQIVDTDGLSIVGSQNGTNFFEGFSNDLGLNFSPILKNWTDAVDKVELANVPEVGDIFSQYPDRSTPAVTGGKSQ